MISLAVQFVCWDIPVSCNSIVFIARLVFRCTKMYKTNNCDQDYVLQTIITIASSKRLFAMVACPQHPWVFHLCFTSIARESIAIGGSKTWDHPKSTASGKHRGNNHSPGTKIITNRTAIEPSQRTRYASLGVWRETGNIHSSEIHQLFESQGTELLGSS